MLTQDEFDALVGTCVDGGTAEALASARKASQAYKEALRRAKRYKAAAEAYRDLSVCHRLQSRPSEALFKRLDRAREAMGG